MGFGHGSANGAQEPETGGKSGSCPAMRRSHATELICSAHSVNKQAVPERVVSVYFDRMMKGKL